MKKTIIILLLAGVGLSWAVHAAGILTEGVNSIKFDRRATGKQSWQKIYAVNVINPNIPYSVKTGGIMQKLKQDFAGSNVELLAILHCGKAEAEKFASSHPEFDFAMSYDEDLAGLRKLLQNSGDSFNQASIFNYSGKLLWSGDPVDLPLLLKLITTQKYNERDEIRIGVHYSELQTALRSGSAKLIGQAADKILELRSEQLSAVNAKAYSLEMTGDHRQLEAFFRSRIKRFPDAPENYIMLIEAALRNPPITAIIPEIAQEFIKNCPDDSENINALAWSLLNNLPFNTQALETAGKAVGLLQKSAIADQSNVLATRALLAYRKCDLALALELITKAQAGAVSNSEKAFLQEMKNYFEHLSKK